MIELPNQTAWLISVFYIVLVNHGVKEDDLREQLGLDPEQLSKIMSPVTIDQFKRLGQIAQKLTGRPDIGLLLGKNSVEYYESNGSIIFNNVLNNPTIRDYLMALEKFSLLFENILDFSVKEENEMCEIYIDFYKAGEMGLPLVEYYTSGFISLLKYLIGDEFKLSRLDFPYPTPHYIDSYHQAFETQLVFNQANTSVCFHRKYLDVSIPQPPVPMIKDLLSKIAYEQLGESNENGSFQTKIRTLIIEHLPTGKVGIELISKYLHMSRTVIYRRLKEENTSYKELLSLTRRQLAKQYLKNPSLTIDMISSMLGYAESSAFKRAFKSWFKVTPGQYRHKARLKPEP